MNRQDELDAMYVILRNGCAGTICTDCPGAKYDHCGDYNKAVNLYEAGWRKPTEAQWVMVKKEDYWIPNITEKSVHLLPKCSNCEKEFGLIALRYSYCPNCGAKMVGKK